MTDRASADARGARLLGELLAGWEEAGGPEVERRFEVAGGLVRVRGPRALRLEELCSAFAHLTNGDTDDAAALDLRVYDSSSAPPPGMPFAPYQLTARGEIHRFDSERFRVAFRFGEYTLNVYDRERRLALVWTRDASRLPVWYRAAPFRTPLHWWTGDRGLQLVHGAGVVRDGRAALIVGRGGSGKSSTALTCMERGFDLLGDDYVVVGGDPFHLWSLYSSVKVVPQQLGGRPSLHGLTPTEDGSFDKSVFFLAPDRDEFLASGAPLEVLLSARVATGSTTSSLATCDALEIDAALSSDTLRHLPHAGHATQQVLNRLSTSVPARRLLLGRDRDGVAKTVEHALRTAPTMAPLQAEEDLERPFVTVILAVERGCSSVPRWIDALEREDYPRIELIILRHDAAEICETPPAERVVVTSLHDQRRLSRPEAFNRGLRESMAELVVFATGDQAWPPGQLRRAVEVLTAEPGVDVVAGGLLPSPPAPDPEPPETDAVPWLFRRSALERIDGFDTGEVLPEQALLGRFEGRVSRLSGLELPAPEAMSESQERDPRVEHVRQWLARKRR